MRHAPFPPTLTLRRDDDVRKDDLIDNLDKYLQANSTRLARNTSFQPYFDTRRTPFKARSSSAGAVTSDDGEVKSVVKARGRRTTKVKPEVEYAPRTPSALSTCAQSLTLDLAMRMLQTCLHPERWPRPAMPSTTP